LYPERTGAYTWWSNRGDLRQQNIGWRLDYIFASTGIPLLSADLYPGVAGSDHCPISVEWEMED
ncbi:MAG: endonuclease/exonuclease/phosphatase family protein, partial [Anaerolineae bacterium]|nr:endonuclease/exonuclease/phosphatase family protein [Anaerolineae bacterium]